MGLTFPLAGKPFGIYGDVPLLERSKRISEWCETDSGVLIGQMDVAGEGLNLQAADLQVFLDVPWTPKQRLQCVDRLHRIGQRNTVTVVDILAEDTVDNKLTIRLQRRIEDAESLTSGAVAKWTRAEMEEVIG